MSPRWARWWFAATALCAFAGVVISAVNAGNNVGGHFHPAAARALNAFAFFTIESNLLQLGYFKALVNCVWVALLLLGLSAGARLLDGFLSSRA